MAEEVKKAGRPAKAKVETTTTDEVKKVEVVENKSDDADKLKAENLAMAEQLKQLQGMMLTLQSQLLSQPQAQPNIVLEQNKDITRTVKVTSLVDNVLTLSTTKNAMKPCHTTKFEKYGQTKQILFTQMQQILSYHTRQFEDGKVILSLEQDYHDLGIGYIYNSVPLKDKIDEIVMLKDDNAIDAIFDMNEDMQEKIVDMIARNIVNGVSYDYNKIKELKNEGFDVEAIAEEIKNIPNKEDEE